MRHSAKIAATALSLLLPGCSDIATFATGTDIGIAASTATRQVQIGYSRVELFQGPNYPDVGDAPQAVGFLGSDLQVFSPHIRQLYATGDAAGIVTTPVPLADCPSQKPQNTLYTKCPEDASDLSGERRPLVFSTGTNVGLKLGFIGDVPSSIKFGYDREEVSVIPLHAAPPPAAPAPAGKNVVDKYSSVLASIDLNVSTPSLLGTDLHLVQFFATGAAARNLAKSSDIQNYFAHAAANSVNPNPAAVQAAIAQVTQDQKDIDAYFSANTGQNFQVVRDKLLNDSALAGINPLMTSDLKNASSSAAFDSALNTSANATFIHLIGPVARRLTPAPAPHG